MIQKGLKMKTVTTLAALSIFSISTMVTADEYILDFNKSDSATIASVSELYNYPSEGISLAKYDLEDNGSLELFVQFDGTCEGNKCFRTVLLNSNGSYNEIFRGTHNQMSIMEGELGSISSIKTDVNTEWNWYSNLRRFVPAFTGPVVGFEDISKEVTSEDILQYYADLYNSRNIKVYDFDLLSDGKQERLVVDLDIQNCMQWKYCRGYLYNSSSSEVIKRFIVGEMEYFSVSDNGLNNTIITQDDHGYSIYAYSGSTLDIIDSISVNSN